MKQERLKKQAAAAALLDEADRKKHLIEEECAKLVFKYLNSPEGANGATLEKIALFKAQAIRKLG